MSNQIACTSFCSVHCPARSNLGLASVDNLYPELLSSTTVPSEAQISVIRDAIHRAEVEIAENQRIADRLQRKRAELGDFVNRHRGVVSTMRRLPSEILSEIFAHNSMPFQIIRVCSRWRAVALASPSLWCRFVLAGPKPLGLLDADIVRIASLQLQRSSQGPLSIYVEGQYDVLDLFLAVSVRWQDITLDLNLQQYQHLFSSGADFPILKKLKLDIQPREWPAADLVTQFFESLPALEDLTLDTDGSTIPSRLAFPWSRLRKCTFNLCQIQDVLRLLALVSPGTHISVEALDLEADNDLEPGLRSPSHITALTIDADNPFVVSEFLSGLAAPALKELVIKVESQAGDCDNLVRQIVAFLAHSTCPLARLRIDAWLDKHHLLGIFASPSVHGLVVLEVWRGDADFSRDAIRVLAEPTLLPHLRDLALTSPCRRDEKLLLSMVASRRPVLQSLRLEGHHVLSQESVDALRGSGLQVILL